jgi:AraC family transcriptional regulator
MAGCTTARSVVSPVQRIAAFIHANLDADLSLAALSRRAGLSPFHFHRRFRDQFGQTCASYVTGARLQRAAYLLVAQDCAVLDVALQCGFTNHATFTRAFRRHYGTTPREFRDRGQLRRILAPPARDSVVHGSFALSATRIQRLREVHLATISYRGGYQRVPARLWAALIEFAKGRHLAPDRLLGIGHDRPNARRPRFDAAITVARPFRDEPRIRLSGLQGGPYAVTSHIGPYASLGPAYDIIVERAQRLPGHRLIGLRAIEVYHATAMRVGPSIEHTEIYLPIEPRWDPDPPDTCRQSEQ